MRRILRKKFANAKLFEGKYFRIVAVRRCRCSVAEATLDNSNGSCEH